MKAGHEDLTAQELRDVQSFVAVGNFAAAKHILLRTRGRTELYNMPVEYMQLTKRATKALRKAGYTTVGMIAGCSFGDLFLIIQNEVEAIRDWMGPRGIRIGTSWEDLDHRSEKALRDREYTERTRVQREEFEKLLRMAESSGKSAFGDEDFD